MRFCLLGLAAIALAQPASAHEHRHHRHHAHHRHHSHHLRLAPDLDTASLPLVTAPVRMRSARHETHNSAYEAMIARHAQANGLPVELVRHVMKKESNFNPRAHNRGALGLMQITHATARGAGYTGSAEGLYDPETNLTYGVRYLAGAYRAAGGNQSRAWALYRSGYYRRGDSTRVRTVSFTAPDAARDVATKEIVVREVAVKHDAIKDQARVVDEPEAPAVVERKPRVVPARVAVARVAADEEPRVRLRHHARRGRHSHEAESGVLDAFLKLAVRGSIQPKRRGPLARAD